MESIENEYLTIGAYIKRNDPRDILVSNKIKKLSDLNGKVNYWFKFKKKRTSIKKN